MMRAVIKIKFMNIKVVKNKYLNALFLLMILSAVAHMLNSIFIAVKSFDIYILNYFNILELDILFPNIFKNTPYGNLSSFVVVLFLYFVMLKLTSEASNNYEK